MLKKLILMIFLLVLAGGCFSSKKEDDGYDLVWKVKDIVSEEVIDAEVKIDSPLITDSATDNMVTIKKSGYYQKVGVVPLVYGQKNLIGYLTKNNSSAVMCAAAGKIIDENGAAVSGAGVVFFGDFTAKKVETDLNGMFKAENIPAGDIEIYVYKNNYSYTIKKLKLNSDISNMEYTIESSSGKSYGDIYGNIKGYKDEICGYSYVTAGIKDSGIYQYTFTDAEGNYAVYGMPYGSYNFTIKSPGFYKINSSSVAVDSVLKTNNITMTIISGV